MTSAYTLHLEDESSAYCCHPNRSPTAETPSLPVLVSPKADDSMLSLSLLEPGSQAWESRCSQMESLTGQFEALPVVEAKASNSAIAPAVWLPTLAS